jgi:glycine/D-amino acid oxidase-like deaminating enzyme
MKERSADILICGAGIAGISTAYHLLKENPRLNVILIDERAPLSLTSDKSSECYRNFWPAPEPSMVQMMNRSIDILEELARASDNIFNLNRRGYVFATARPEQTEAYLAAARKAQENGAGPMRVHTATNMGQDYQPAPSEGFEDQPDGADVFLDGAVVQRYFPELADTTVGLLHIRRAGWLSAQQLGMYMLQQSQAAGLSVVHDRVEGVLSKGGRIEGAQLAQEGLINTGVFVNAAGPFIEPVGKLMGLDLPIINELHLKSSFHDHLGIVPRGAPMLIWGDPQHLDWPEEDREFLAESDDTRWLLDEFPAGVHTRPEGVSDSDIVLLLWEYHSADHPVEFPIELDPEYPELALRGICRMLPAMAAYLDRLPQPVLDGGYYTKTRENRPLSCGLPVQGAYMIGALSGFGIMAAPGLGELLAAQINGTTVPVYAPAFDLKRYEDPEYKALLANWGNLWQL